MVSTRSPRAQRRHSHHRAMSATRPGARHLDRAAMSIAHSTTRRQFLGRLGAAGLTAGLGFGFLVGMDWRREAFARGSCASGACGPSPICSSSNCTTGGQCSSGAGAARRVYDTFNYCPCSNPNCANCWAEGPYGAGCSTPGSWSCCDCCAYSGGAACNGSLCTGFEGPWRCICRKKT